MAAPCLTHDCPVQGIVGDLAGNLPPQALLTFLGPPPPSTAPPGNRGWCGVVSVGGGCPWFGWRWSPVWVLVPFGIHPCFTGGSPPSPGPGEEGSHQGALAFTLRGFVFADVI